ncbi:efflux RND transporter periplasmic adaptor subunit [Devosia sp. A8/3-2]|nr:efflux RND transporter periplasmic adaptor subunit [Devosia sp. A8/3-2]
MTRTRGLANSNVVAPTAPAAARLAAANADLELRNASVALGRRTITSPIAGTIGLIRVTLGNYVPAQTTVTTVDDTSAISVDFWVPERYASAIAPGMPVSVTAIALPGRVFDGEVNAVDNRLDPASRTLQCRPRSPMRTRPCAPACPSPSRCAFPANNSRRSIRWPSCGQPRGSYVWKYADGKATRVMAEIIQRNSDGVLVRADLKPGDAIITEGILQLSEGAEVTLLSGPDGTAATQEAQATQN